MDDVDINEPPAGLLTPEEMERWSLLQEEKIDALRKRRELLLDSYNHRPPGWSALERLDKEFEEIASYFCPTPEERAGMLLLSKEGFSRLSELVKRWSNAALGQIALIYAARKRRGTQ